MYDYIKELDRLDVPFWPIEPYVNMKTKIMHECIDTHKRTHEEYVLELAEIGMEALNSYTDNSTPLLHKCVSKGHTVYTTPVNLLYRTHGCTFCLSNGPGTLYYLKFSKGEETFYKVGITTKTVEDRINTLGIKDPEYTVTVLRKIEYASVADARHIEQLLLRECKEYRTKVDFVSNGNTEFFLKDIVEYLDART